MGWWKKARPRLLFQREPPGTDGAESPTAKSYKRNRYYGVQPNSQQPATQSSWRSPRSSRHDRQFEPKETQSVPSSPYESIESFQEIRLLFLQPALEGNGLSCKVTRQRESSDLFYYALSYTWGGTDYKDEPAHILCNGFNMPVTANCLQFLTLLQRLGLNGPFWMDALCINQDDLEERNDQVAKMGDIFRNAERTLIFLNEEDIGMTAPSEPLPMLEMKTTPEGETELSEFHTFSFSFDQDTEGHDLLKPEIFYRSPWFTRTWIVQEVLSSKCLSFLTTLSDRAIAWEVACTAYDHWRQRHLLRDVPDIVLLRERQDQVQRDQDTSFGHHGGISTSPDRRRSVLLGAYADIRGPETLASARLLSYDRLFEVLETTRHFKSKDPRDKLYAVLALFDRPMPSLLQPNYATPAIDVFINLTWFLLESNRPEVLSLASLNHPDPKTPSWAVDWSDPRPQAERLERNIPVDSTWSAGCWPNRSRIFARRLSFDCILLRGRSLGCVESFDREKGPNAWFVNSNGWYRGFGTRQYSAAKGDEACTFLGFRCAFILRPFGAAYKIVDQCRIDGIMEGQGLAGIKAADAYRQRPCGRLVDFEIC